MLSVDLTCLEVDVWLHEPTSNDADKQKADITIILLFTGKKLIVYLLLNICLLIK